MPCSDCKHWRSNRTSNSFVYRNQGVCVLLSEEAKIRDEGQTLYHTPKTTNRLKKRRGMVKILVTWPEAILPELNIVTYTQRDFSCAMYDRDRRRKPRTTLPVVPTSGGPPRRYQLLLDDVDSADRKT